ncbi:hypothetical protein FHT44_006177 [Mycolicibacterium sp. BK634]|uniref:hypothetical protein n=1 Tax=Mycolicibacterium sp. BK634 TaxID=2587099 RepID=UPI00161ADC25|nr:hypothetical protein [Mycolicibacterium sp. BK634]MBB3753655.1 hypothetical protein [Mycolicibacterium sp. BK634]
MDVAQQYLSEMDRILTAACTLFPDTASPTVTVLPTVSPVTQQGQGGLVDSANERAASYIVYAQRAAAAVESADLAAADAATTASNARITAQGIRDRARSEAQARDVGSTAPESLQALVSRMDDALARMQTHITTVQDDLSGKVERIRSAAKDLGANLPDHR